MFSLCELVWRSLRLSWTGNQVYKCFRMLFQEVIYQHKKRIGVCNLYREMVKSIKTGLFFIEARVSLSLLKTVLTKWRPCQDKIMTTTAAIVKKQAKTIQDRSKVPQLTNENTNNIAGSNFLNPIQRHRKCMERQSWRMPWNKSNWTSTSNWTRWRRRCHNRLEFGYSSRVGLVRENGRKIRKAGAKLREQEARQTQEKEEWARLESKNKF